MRTASFDGTLDGRPVTAVGGRVAHQGSEPYLLLGLEDGASDWVLDVSGLSGGPLRLTLIDRRQRRYTGPAEGRVQADGAVVRIREFHGRAAAADGSTVALEGEFAFDAAEGPEHLDGEVELALGPHELGPIRAAARPFGEEWLVTALFPLPEGGVVDLSLWFPGPQTTTWLRPQARLELLVSEQRGGSPVQTRVEADPFCVDAEWDGTTLLLDFAGSVRAESETWQFRGCFRTDVHD